MERKILAQLVNWKDKKDRMPLILNGARQVGKTYVLKQFGSECFENMVYVNLENRDVAVSFFEQELNPERLIRYLETISEQRIVAGKTLVFLDEIQSNERALASLKVFCEEAPQYHIVAAGSLLGVAVNREKYSFPVGKVDELTLYPLDFEEFMWAMDKKILSDEIRAHFIDNQAFPDGLHRQALELYYYYLITGGMPAVVKKFAETRSLLEINDIQGNILNEYLADMAKYSSPATTVKIRACYNSIPVQLAKENTKFQYKVVKHGGTATIFGESIDWLILAGIVLKCQKIDQAFMPISVYADLSDFKLYMGDVGLLTMKSGIAHQTVLSALEQDNNFLGAMTENFVAQQFTARKLPLFYWKNDNTAEVDFILQLGQDIVPVEVKKGRRNRAVSLNMFMKKYESPYAIRISQKNFGFENNIRSVPLYAVHCI